MTSADLAVKTDKLGKPKAKGRWLTTYDKQTADVVIDAVGRGVPLKRAGELAGVKYPTLEGWIRKGTELEDSEYEYLAAGMTQARAEFISECIDKLNKAGDDPRFWAAIMTLLERTDSEHFARASDKAGGTTINIAVGNLEKQIHELDGPEAEYSGG